MQGLVRLAISAWVAGLCLQAPGIIDEARSSGNGPQLGRKASQACPSETVGKFENFARKWLKRLEADSPGKQNPLIVREHNGTFTARYLVRLPESKIISVEHCPSRSDCCLGLLIYTERLYESSGPTREKAKTGLFRARYESTVTEIFLYNDGRWK